MKISYKVEFPREEIEQFAISDEQMQEKAKHFFSNELINKYLPLSSVFYNDRGQKEIRGEYYFFSEETIGKMISDLMKIETKNLVDQNLIQDVIFALKKDVL